MRLVTLTRCSRAPGYPSVSPGCPSLCAWEAPLNSKRRNVTRSIRDACRRCSAWAMGSKERWRGVGDATAAPSEASGSRSLALRQRLNRCQPVSCKENHRQPHAAGPFISSRDTALAQKPCRNSGIIKAFARSMKKAHTRGTIMKAMCEAPYRWETAAMFAIAVGVEPNDIPPNPEQMTAAS